MQQLSTLLHKIRRIGWFCLKIKVSIVSVIHRFNKNRNKRVVIELIVYWLLAVSALGEEIENFYCLPDLSLTNGQIWGNARRFSLMTTEEGDKSNEWSLALAVWMLFVASCSRVSKEWSFSSVAERGPSIIRLPTERYRVD